MDTLVPGQSVLKLWTCCTPTVNHRPASPDKAQIQAVALLAWALTALAPVYRLYRLHTRQKYEQQEPVWPPTALRTAPGAQPLHALRGAEVDYRLSERRAARREPAKRRGSVLVHHEDVPQPLRSGLQACGRRW